MKKKKVILIMMGILLIAIIGILIYLCLHKNPEEEPKQQVIASEKTANDQETERQRLRQMEEGDRIKTYVGKYMKLIEQEDYASAYNLLYPEFKNYYFPTLNDYISYIESCHYPEMLAITYQSITMRGNYYIITIGIGNLLNTTTRESEQKIILKENDYNDFVLSFQKNS